MRTARLLPVSPNMHCVGESALPGGGVSLPGAGIPACNGADPSPTMNTILDTRLWKYYLAPTSLRAVTTHSRFS